VQVGGVYRLRTIAKKEEGRGKKEEGRRKKEEGITMFYLIFSSILNKLFLATGILPVPDIFHSHSTTNIFFGGTSILPVPDVFHSRSHYGLA
jgi:hypothetical protein